MTSTWSAPSPSSIVRKVYLDPHGDLSLVVGNEQRSSRVSSQALARASPVLDAMLFRGFAESQKAASGDWVVELPEDDPAALCILLYLIHGRIADVPSSLSDERLYSVTVVSDKYDLTHVLRPWARTWIDSLIRTDPERWLPIDSPSRIWIAWELGHHQMFADHCRKLLYRSSIDADDNLCDTAGPPLDTYPMLSNLDIVESLTSERHQLISSLLAPVDNLLQDLLSIDKSRPSTWRCTVDITDPNMPEQKSCEIIVLGMLVKALASVGLYPLPRPSSCTHSPNIVYHRLLDMLHKMKCLWHGTPPSYQVAHGTDCMFHDQMQMEIEAAFNTRHSIVTEKHKSRLMAQAGKSGIQWDPYLDGHPLL